MPCALASPKASPLAVTQIAPGVFFHPGQQDEENAHNHGDIANIGFMIGSDCVAVIDTGGSPRIGRQLRAAVRRRSSKPICYVINTHIHPDHVLGNKAFTGADTVFIAHAGFARALAARAQTYLDRLAGELAQKPNASWIVLPDRSVAHTLKLNLGGRVLVLRAWPAAHTTTDLSVYDTKTATLWLSDLLFVNRVPSLDASITGWLDVLHTLAKRQDVARVVPGHGPVQTRWPRALIAERGYLESIKKGVRKALDRGRSLAYAANHVARDQRGNWLLFDAYNPRNVTKAYTELEWQ